MMDQAAMGRRMEAGPQQMSQTGESPSTSGAGGESGGPGDAIKNVDQIIGALAQSMTKIPGQGPELAKAMMDVKNRFRAIIQAAMAASQGGATGGAPQGAQGQAMPQAGAPQGPQPERGQGRPYSPAGVA